MTEERFDEQDHETNQVSSGSFSDEFQQAVKASGLIPDLMQLKDQFISSDSDLELDFCGFEEGMRYATDAFSEGPLTGIEEQDWEREHDDEAEAVRRFCEIATNWTAQDWYDEILVWENVAAAKLRALMGISHDESIELFEDLEAMVANGDEESIYFDEPYIHAFARGMLAVYQLRNVSEWPQPVSFPGNHGFGTGPFADLRAAAIEDVKQALQMGDAVRKQQIDKNEEMILEYGVTAEQFMAMSDEEQTELVGQELEESDEEGEEWKRGLPDEDD